MIELSNLHYRWNELQQSENYEHDLLRKVVAFDHPAWPTSII